MTKMNLLIVTAAFCFATAISAMLLEVDRAQREAAAAQAERDVIQMLMMQGVAKNCKGVSI